MQQIKPIIKSIFMHSKSLPCPYAHMYVLICAVNCAMNYVSGTQALRTYRIFCYLIFTKMTHIIKHYYLLVFALHHFFLVPRQTILSIGLHHRHLLEQIASDIIYLWLTHTHTVLMFTEQKLSMPIRVHRRYHCSATWPPQFRKSLKQF